MLTIACPHCGPRAEIEFAFGGDATVERPADPALADDAAWTAYLYLRDNPKGPRREHWFHRHGCRRWLLVERDSVTHRITAVAAASDRP